MKKFRFNLLILLTLFCILFSLTSCGAKTVTWNGDTEYYAHISMVVDETNLYEYVGVVDYVFVGTVEKIVTNVIPDEPNGSDEDLSVYDADIFRQGCRHRTSRKRKPIYFPGIRSTRWQFNTIGIF